jgi:hypothetical protein
MATTPLSALFAKRSHLLRELASTEDQLALLLDGLVRPESTDEALTLKEAAKLFGESPHTFRQRLEFRKALISRVGERRLRYSRAELERIKRDRIAANAVGVWHPVFSGR